MYLIASVVRKQIKKNVIIPPMMMAFVFSNKLLKDKSGKEDYIKQDELQFKDQIFTKTIAIQIYAWRNNISFGGIIEQ